MKKELSDLKEAFRWSLMSRAELRALSAARGLRFSAWTPRSRVILALMDHAAGRPADRPGASAAGSGEHERALCCESARYLQTCNLAPRPFRYGNLSPSEAVPWAQAMADQRLSPARAVRRRRGRPPRSGFAGPSLHGSGPALGKPRSRASARACRQARTCTDPPNAHTNTSANAPRTHPHEHHQAPPCTSETTILLSHLTLSPILSSSLDSVKAVAFEGSKHACSSNLWQDTAEVCLSNYFVYI